MVSYRAAYALLRLLTVIAYSLPWATVDGRPYVGWNLTVSFSTAYLMGLPLGLVVLVAGFRPVTMAIIAGVLVLLGVAGAFLGLGAAAVLAGLARGRANPEAGMGLALLVSMVYTVLGAYVGRKLVVRRAR
jgi:predicted PurR-regulated permease PerM